MSVFRRLSFRVQMKFIKDLRLLLLRVRERHVWALTHVYDCVEWKSSNLKLFTYT